MNIFKKINYEIQCIKYFAKKGNIGGSRKKALEETKKMLENIKFSSDNYDLDKRIDILEENDIHIKVLKR